MQRVKLKNIISKSQALPQQPVGEPYDLFVASLPSELDYYKDGGKYRLKAAWKAYGEPKNYQEARFYGMIESVDGINYKMPSIGYNEENDSYEYLNVGKDNDIVAKDIRVWDNDVIPLIKELKLGGYVRTFNEEENFWTYCKNTQERQEPTQTNEQQVIQESATDVEVFKQGGQMNVIPEGALHAHKNHMELAEEGEVTNKGVPVVSKKGGEIQQHAEIEREEIILNLTTTQKIEMYFKKYKEEESQSKKDEIAIKCGKMLAKSIIEDTDDKTGLMEKIAENGK